MITTKIKAASKMKHQDTIRPGTAFIGKIVTLDHQGNQEGPICTKIGIYYKKFDDVILLLSDEIRETSRSVGFYDYQEVDLKIEAIKNES